MKYEHTLDDLVFWRPCDLVFAPINQELTWMLRIDEGEGGPREMICDNLGSLLYSHISMQIQQQLGDPDATP